MKRVYSDKTAIGLLVFCLIVCIGFGCFCIAVMIPSIRTGEQNLAILAAIVGCFFLMIAVLTVCILNRAGCKVIYDPDKNMLYRKGLWWGYNYQLKVEEIKEIVIVFLPREDIYYVLLDSVNTKYEGWSKKSYIKLRETKENQIFIRQFWDKPIKEYRTYDDYVRLVTNDRA